MIDENPGDERSISKEDKIEMQSRTFGDECLRKKKDNIRVMFQNVNGFGYTSKSAKSIGVRNLMFNKGIDIMAMAELNLNWGKMKRKCTLPQVCRKWFRTSKTVVAYNQHERRKRNVHQPGGTAVVAKGEMALRSGEALFDDKRLGRWASQVVQGKQGIKTRIVAVYVPIWVSKHGHKKVAHQQQKALLKMGITESVLTVFWNDFWTQVDKWLDDGEQLVIGGDWNIEVTKEKFLEEFTKRNLIPVISSKFGNNLPPTHNNGSYPIDEIFASSTLKVEAAGYLEHGSNLSDHRPLWVDFSRNTFLGLKATLNPTFATRRLKTNDPRVVDKYLFFLTEELKINNVKHRTEVLHSVISSPMTAEQQQEYEELDQLRHEAARIAEKKCRRLKMGHVRWSPTLQNARDRIYYFSLTKRKKLGRKVSTCILYRLSKKTGCIGSHMTIEELDVEIKNAYVYYRTLKKQNYKLREEFLDELAAVLEKRGKGKKASIVKNLLHIENQRDMFRKLAAINKKNNDLSTKCVTISTPEGKIVLTDKIQMETAIANENRAKYHQTESSCPFMHPPLREHFGDLGIGTKTKEVLEGNYTPPDHLSQHTKDYLELCKIPEGELVYNPMTRSLDYFTRSWKKMRERTSSRGLHFGHYRASAECNYVMEILYHLAEIPFRTGSSPQRWKHANNVMILKKEGVSDLDRLRTLVLFESDFNHNNKFLGRQTMHHMLDQNFMAQEQYSTPGKKCIDHVLNRRLFFDLVRYKKTSAAMAAVDLKSCYDRVAHSPAYLALRSYGVPSNAVQGMFQTLQDMKYYTVTAHGTSKNSFGGKEKGYIAAPNGLGQGNGAGPQVWSVVSSKMFEVMHKQGSGTNITSPLTNEETNVCGFAYVDDTDLIAMTDTNDTGIATERMQKIVNDWEAVSKTTGGALVPSKCWAWVIGFGWSGDNWHYKKTANDGIEMSIKNAEECLEQMKKLQPDCAKEMLGVRLAPDGNNKAQISAMKEKMKMFAENMRVGHVNKHEAWVNLTQIAMKSLEYMLPAMTITEDEYKSIMSPVFDQFLPKMGLNRKMKRDILHAPNKVQGLNVNNPYILQGAEHIKDISEHLWKNTLTGKMLRCNLEQLRLEIGENIKILSSDYNQFKDQLLTDSYMENTWSFMSTNKVKLDEGTATVGLLRNNDITLMEAFRQHPKIPQSNLKQLNRCRIYIHAFTLSDITTSCGKYIRQEAWHGRKYNNGRNVDQWPKWGRPCLQAWTYWRTALKLVFCTDKDRVLKTPLTDWFGIPSEWEWFVTDSDPAFLLHKITDQEYHIHKRLGRSKITLRFSENPTEHITRSLEGLLPVTVKPFYKSYISDFPYNTVGEKDNGSNDIKRTEWLNIERIRRGATQRLVQAIKTNCALAVSDGSYIETKGIGTASWIISTFDKTAFITAGALSPGNKEIQSAYRSEILGILGVLEELYAICVENNISSGMCTIMCDGLSALQVIERLNRQTLHSRYNSCDLLSACVSLRERIPITLRFAHVKGHQDESTDIQFLSTPAQLNVMMDGLAKELAETTCHEETKDLLQHYLGFSLPHSNGYFIRQDFKKEIYNAIMTRRAHEYWMKKNRYKQQDIECIEWQLQAKAFASEKRGRQRNLTKWFSGWLGTGKNMKRWGLRYSGNCPFCGYPDEDTTHILKCQHDLPLKAWKAVLTTFDGKLIKLKTNFQLRKMIIKELRAWHNNTAPSSLKYIDEELKTAVEEQRRIGWRSFLEGLISIKLIAYQEDYYRREQKNRKVSNWTKKMIKAGWSVIMTIWDHRNDYLHKPDTLHELEGKKLLNKAILREWSIGLGDLPAFDFTHLFRIKKEKLMKKSIASKKDWLATVKMARQLHEDRNRIEDEFDTNKALRDWIDLPKLAKEQK